MRLARDTTENPADHDAQSANRGPCANVRGTGLVGDDLRRDLRVDEVYWLDADAQVMGSIRTLAFLRPPCRFRHPAIVVTAQRILDAGPSVVHKLSNRRFGAHRSETVPVQSIRCRR